jgi:hypothetical protein
MTSSDLVLEAIIAAEYGESAYTWRNRRRRGEGPPHYRLPGRKSATYYSREETAAFYRQFRVVPPVTARQIEETQKRGGKAAA